MAFERIETLRSEQITPENIVASIREMLDDSAKIEFDKAAEGVISWVRLRLAEAGLFASQRNMKFDEVRLGLNAYNRSLGFGIQSVAISCLGNGSEVLQGESEYQDPRIGVIADGLVGENAKMAVRGFPVWEGNTEVVMSQTEGLLLDAANESELFEGEVEEAPFKGTVYVEGPNFARTILEVAERVDVETQAIRKKVKNAGVYICQYFKRRADAMEDEELAREVA